jgi:hypothetical protein
MAVRHGSGFLEQPAIVMRTESAMIVLERDNTALRRLAIPWTVAAMLGRALAVSGNAMGVAAT